MSLRQTSFVLAATDPQFNAINYVPRGGLYSAIGAPLVLLVGDLANLYLRAFPLSGVINSADIRLNGGFRNCALSTYIIYPFLQGIEEINRYGAESPL